MGVLEKNEASVGRPRVSTQQGKTACNQAGNLLAALSSQTPYRARCLLLL